jgi:hypothetical protein
LRCREVRVEYAEPEVKGQRSAARTEATAKLRTPKIVDSCAPAHFDLSVCPSTSLASPRLHSRSYPCRFILYVAHPTREERSRKFVSELNWVMNSRHYFTGKFFQILVFACAIFVTATQTQARESHTGARLLVQRAANFGTEVVVHLEIDGRKVAEIQRDHRYEGFVSAGRHVLTVSPMPNVELRRPTSLHVTMRSGRTYIFTAMWDPDRNVVLRRTTTPVEAAPAKTVPAH